MFDGHCEEALNFYAACLNGKVGYLGRYSDSPLQVPDLFKNKIVTAGLNLSLNKVEYLIRMPRGF